MEKCKTKNCNNEVRARGICHTCYNRFSYWIKQGQTTWKELEHLDLVDAKKGLAALEAARAEAAKKSKGAK